MNTRSLTPWLLALLFAAPFIASWAMFFNPAWLPEQRVNHGELIRPGEPMHDVSLDLLGGGNIALAARNGTWRLLFIANHCRVQCKQTLWNLRQVRRALGTERSRLDRLLLLEQPPTGPLGDLLASEYPQLAVAVASEENRQRLSGHLGRAGISATEGIYVLDPRGNLMMRYPAGAEPEGILDDMQRLLKVSEHWGNDENT